MKLQTERGRSQGWRGHWPLIKRPDDQRDQPLRRRSLRWVVVAFSVVVAVGLSWQVSHRLGRPAEVVYWPTADAYVSSAHPNMNYGRVPTLRADATPKIRSYLRFRFNGLSGRIVRAEFRIWSRTGDLVGYSVHPAIATDWGEMDITSSNVPAASKPFASSGPFGPQSWSAVDVTRMVQGDNGLSLVLISRSHQNILFDSREGLNKPQLVIQTSPVPHISLRLPIPDSHH
jgi:hypothetical protein